MSNQIEKELDNDNKNNKTIPHFLMVPMLSPGHMIPMIDLAHLIAERGALVTFITTPLNAAKIKPTIDRVNKTSLPIKFVELNFNCEEAGVPEGCESFELLTPEYYGPFLNGLRVLQKPLESYLETIKSKPTCTIYDSFQWWTMNIAEKLDIPGLVFMPFSGFYSICSHNITKYKIYKDVCDEYQLVEIPDLPCKVCVTKATTPELFVEPGFGDFGKDVIKSEEAANGVVLHTFKGLEHEYLELYEKTLGKRVWALGPFSLYNKDVSSKASRGQKANVDEISILNWLDSKESKSVILVTFGSIVYTGSSQIIELGCGLEASNKPFIWVIKEFEKTPEVVNWISGFEERTKGRGLVITGWAPQMLILSHRATGGIMTHCGWSSTIEAISAGIPMITYPEFGDQFLNEKLVVEILKIGISFGTKEPRHLVEEGKVHVGRDEVKKAVINLMEGREAEEMKKRAQKYREMAHIATEEGGSSFESLSSLIQFAMEPCVVLIICQIEANTEEEF